jgi:hypothetical protein
MKNLIAEVGDLIKMIALCGFNSSIYLANNPDLSAAGLDETGVTLHYLLFGYKEGRAIPTPASLAVFTALARAISDETSYVASLFDGLVLGGLRSRNQDPSVWNADDSDFIPLFERSSRKPYVLIGDSHSNLYVRYNASAEMDLAPIHLLCGAGSAMGLNNSASKSQYGQRLKVWIKDARFNIELFSTPVFLKFGQVDTEFVWTFDRIRKGRKYYDRRNFEEFSSRSVKAYCDFLDDFCTRIDPSVLRICSIFPPTLSDAAWTQGYMNAHVNTLEGEGEESDLKEAIQGLEIPDLAERTKLHAYYNDQLRTEAESRGLIFIDDFSPLVGEQGVVDDVFMLDHNGDDHHLRFSPIAPEIERLLLQEITRARSTILLSVNTLSDSYAPH